MQSKLFDHKVLAQALAQQIAEMPLAEKVQALNEVRTILHVVSPFKNEPVDLVLWVPNETVFANGYNPNKVAKTEMKLLEDSISADGFTQPIVTYAEENPDRKFSTVVDGYHRKIVGSDGEIREKLHGYLPITTIDKSIEERMFSTVRHNRARGKHAVDLMADLVRDLIENGCTDEEIAQHLGMTGEELTRLKQAVGIARLFAIPEYTRAWGESDEI